MEATAKPVRVRIAPSPTGFFHVGNARTAIFNWLFARQNGGSFILRIEDTDKERSRVEYDDDILQSLEWLGLDWDEGPVQSGAFGSLTYKDGHGPYRQSERTEIYAKYLQKLLEEKKAYWCFCTKEELEDEKQAFVSQGLSPRYSGKCRHLSYEDAQKIKDGGRGAVIRIKTPETVVEFNDIIRGKVKFDAALFGDMVIAKNLDAPLYNFSATVDDYEMEITHVIRGEDHLANTPKQILIQKALGFDDVHYAHLPLILSPQRNKLSKRTGDTALRDYRKKGYLPETILNFLSLLGWHPEGDNEILHVEELIKNFSLKKVQKSGAIFNEEKLDWLNSVYIKSIPIDKLVIYVKDFIPEEWTSREELLRRALGVERSRMRLLTDFRANAGFFFELSDYDPGILKWKEMSGDKIKEVLRGILDILVNYGLSEAEERIMAFAEKEGRGEVLWPLRAALSGLKTSPGPFEIIKVLGQDESARRIQLALKKI